VRTHGQSLRGNFFFCGYFSALFYFSAVFLSQSSSLALSLPNSLSHFNDETHFEDDDSIPSPLQQYYSIRIVYVLTNNSHRRCRFSFVHYKILVQPVVNDKLGRNLYSMYTILYTWYVIINYFREKIILLPIQYTYYLPMQYSRIRWIKCQQNVRMVKEKILKVIVFRNPLFTLSSHVHKYLYVY